MHFADQIIKRCQERDSRLVVGLDPHWDKIPDNFKQNYEPLDYENIIADYLTIAIKASNPYAVAYKPQIAFFEQYGLAGMRALVKVLDVLKEEDALIIMDGKRNDIGSTASAYARAFFGDEQLPAGFPSDALTVNGYLGSDGINPFIKNKAKGIFVLVKTSNPSSGELQDMKMANGTSLAETMAAAVHNWNEPTLGKSGYGNVGSVVGATYPEHMKLLRKLMSQSLILVPGYGAQGGAEAAVKAAFNEDKLGALINSSRGILFPKGVAEAPASAIEAAAKTAKDHINHIIS